MNGLISFAVALVASLVLTVVVRRFALRLGFVDKPNHRKIHSEPIALLGGIAIYSGILLGMIVSENAALERVVMPYVFGMQSVPKIAIAPLLLIWFGFGLTSKALLAGLLAFFPVLINTYAGMRMVDRDSLRLFRSLKARRWQVLWKLKLPHALPSILAGLDIAVVQSLLGAVVAEFISGKDGIGVAILQYQFINDTAGVFSALAVLAVTGIALHWGVRTVEKKVLFWKPGEEVKLGKDAA